MMRPRLPHVRLPHARLPHALLALPLLALAAAAPDNASAPAAISLAPVELASATARLALEPSSPSLASGALQPAPVPDVQTALPTTVAEAGSGAQLSPQVYRQHEQFGGDGFSSGSSVQSTQQRERPALGLGIAVPVD